MYVLRIPRLLAVTWNSFSKQFVNGHLQFDDFWACIIHIPHSSPCKQFVNGHLQFNQSWHVRILKLALTLNSNIIHDHLFLGKVQMYMWLNMIYACCWWSILVSSAVWNNFMCVGYTRYIYTPITFSAVICTCTYGSSYCAIIVSYIHFKSQITEYTHSAGCHTAGGKGDISPGPVPPHI